MKNYICIIPARGGSKSVKNKNLKELNNKPLLYYAITSAIKSNKFSNIIVTSDSKKILDYSKKFNITLHKRSKKNSRNNSTTHDTIKEVIKNNVDTYRKNIVILQPTSPFRKSKHIVEAINKFEKFKDADPLVSIQKCSHNMIPESLMKLSGNYLTFIKKNNLFRKQDKPTYFARNGAAIYITRYDKIEKYIIGGKILYYLMNKIDSIDIDDEEDLKIARLLSKKIL